MTQRNGRLTELKTALKETGEEITNLANSWKDETGKGHLVISAEQHNDYVKADRPKADADPAGHRRRGEGQRASSSTSTPRPAPPPPRADAAAHASAARQQVEVPRRGVPRLRRVQVDEGRPGSSDRRDVHDRARHPRPRRRRRPRTSTPPWAATIEIPSIWVGAEPRLDRRGPCAPAASATCSRPSGPPPRCSTASARPGYTNRARVGARAHRRGRWRRDRWRRPTSSASSPSRNSTIVPVTYPIATIAHIMYVHRNTLDDEPRLRGILDRDMIDGVKMAEDEQILWGDGIGENLTGLMNTPGVQNYTGLVHGQAVGAGPARRDPRDPRLLPADRGRDAPVRLGGHRVGDRQQRCVHRRRLASPSVARSGCGASRCPTPRRMPQGRCPGRRVRHRREVVRPRGGQRQGLHREPRPVRAQRVHAARRGAPGPRRGPRPSRSWT